MGASMIVGTRVWIIARLAQIGHELNRLKDLQPAEQSRQAKVLRVERLKLTRDLKATEHARTRNGSR